MTKYLVQLVFLLIAPVNAMAGCVNFEDGSLPNVAPPRYEICFDNTCDITTLSYECANQSSWQRGFANGWATEQRADSTGTERVTITWQGRTIDPAKHHRITFTEILD